MAFPLSRIFPLLLLTAFGTNSQALAVMPVSPAKLSKSTVENLAYYSTMSEEHDKKIQLKKGKFEAPPGEGFMEIEKIVWGDLNGDGLEDAAVQLVINGGGTGYFRNLQIVLNQKGKPALINDFAPLGDRSIIKKFTIQNGIIQLDMVVAGEEDGACCPTQHVTMKFKLNGQKLVKQK